MMVYVTVWHDPKFYGDEIPFVHSSLEEAIEEAKSCLKEDFRCEDHIEDIIFEERGERIFYVGNDTEDHPWAYVYEMEMEEKE
jgi:hypothetical protein